MQILQSTSIRKCFNIYLRNYLLFTECLHLRSRLLTICPKGYLIGGKCPGVRAWGVHVLGVSVQGVQFLEGYVLNLVCIRYRVYIPTANNHYRCSFWP